MTDKLLLQACPCGSIPDRLFISDAGQGNKYANVSAGCCGEWSIEFRNNYAKFDSEESMELAIEAWNNAPRGKR